MGKVTFYENISDYQKYVKSITSKFIGIGAEGSVYLTKDNDVIKLYGFPNKRYAPGRYIMDDDIKLDSFIFPKELFVCDSINKDDGKICGARMDYFDNNLFNQYDNIDDIDLDKLLIAREKFMADAKEISKEGYFLADLSCNILFDNNTLKAIDTLSYTKREYCSSEEIELDNTYMVDLALLYALRFASGEHLSLNDSMEDNIKKLKKIQKKISS